MGSCSSEKMKGGHLLIVTVLGLLALSEGGHLFGKGLVKGAFSSLFKSEKKEQNCEIKWEDVWKPHCTTTYEKVCKQEPKKECSTEWREECWTEHEEKCETEWSSECQTEYRQQCRTEWVEECWEEDEEICEWLQDCHEPHHEPEEHHYSPKPSSHGHHESPEPTVQAGGQVKRSAGLSTRRSARPSGPLSARPSTASSVGLSGSRSAGRRTRRSASGCRTATSLTTSLRSTTTPPNLPLMAITSLLSQLSRQAVRSSGLLMRNIMKMMTTH